MSNKKTPRLEVVNQNETGRNTRFRDTQTGEEMSRSETVRRIERGNYPDYHVRDVNGVKTPASNPDNSGKNNLG